MLKIDKIRRAQQIVDCGISQLECRMHCLQRSRALGPFLGIVASHHNLSSAVCTSRRTIICSSVRSCASSTADEAASPPHRPPPPLEFLDVPYFEGEGACDNKHRLDVYIPGAPFPRPRSRACLFVHGGSWQRGDRRHPNVPGEFYGNVGRALAAAGMVGLVMSYRLAPGVQHPEQVRDVARAVRWAKDNVSRYGGDPRDLVLIGHSAGAHLAALCLSDAQWLAEQGLVVPTAFRPLSSPLPLQPPIVTGFVGISGVYDIPRMAGNVIGEMLATAAFGDEQRAWRRASPVHCVEAAGGAGGSEAGNLTDPGIFGEAAVSETARLRDLSVNEDVVFDSEEKSSSLQVNAISTDTSRSRTQQADREKGHGNKPADVNGAAISDPFFTAGDSRGQGGGSRHDGFPPSPSPTADVLSSAAPHGTTVRTRETAISPLPSLCPLATTRVLLVTASSDFHLREDAHALAQTLEGTCREMMTASLTTRTGSTELAEQQSDKGSLDRNPAAEATAAPIRNNYTEGRKRRGDGSTDRGSHGGSSSANVRCGGGSVRHVCLQGEDHVSTIVSFGQPGKESSDVVLEFILGLPRPSPLPPPR